MFDIILIHPKVVHFTIALFSLAVLLDVIGMITKNEKFHWAALLNLIFAGAAAIVTVISGLLAESNVLHNDAAHEIMETHETLGFIVLGSILLLLIWRIILKGNFPGKAVWLYLIIGIGGIGVMFVGADYGGEMVYTHGVAVKAVPVEEHAHDNGDDGHDHGEAGEESHEEEDARFQSGNTEARYSQGIDSVLPDSQQAKKDVHKHADGSEHVHE